AFSAGLDVIGHEMTHGVTQYTSNLNYQGESGALNESNSDIFGCTIEHWKQPDATKNIEIGETLGLQTSTGFRNIAHPGMGAPPQPAAKGDPNYYTGSQDNGGVHYNSGVPNNAWYLIMAGGTNDYTHKTVTNPLGWDQAIKVWYQAQTHYFTSSTNFAAAASA